MGGENPETDIGGDRSTFQSTLWSIVLRAQEPSSRDRGEALKKLIEAYWKPLYYFIRRKGEGVEASKDIVQGFFTALLEKDFLKYVDRGRGKFRTFLLTAVQHYLADEFDRAKAQKRGGGRPVLSLDFDQAEKEARGLNGGSESADRAFLRDWAVHVMAQAMDALRMSYATQDRAAEFEAFKAYLTSARPEGVSYEDVARTLGISVEDVRNRVRSTRASFREAILDVIRSYTHSEEKIRDELRDLLSAFS